MNNKLINEFIEPVKVKYINIDARTERKESMEKQFREQNIKFERFSAFKPNLPLAKYGLSAGALGCFLSHFNIIKQAKDEGYEGTLIIFEDDVHILPNFKSRVNSVLLNLPSDWEFCFLSFYHYINFSGTKIRPTNLFPNQLDYYNIINDVVMKFNYPLCTHTYMIHSRAFDKVLQFLTDNIIDIDVCYMLMQNTVSVHLAIDNLTYQNWDILSDILMDNKGKLISPNQVNLSQNVYNTIPDKIPNTIHILNYTSSTNSFQIINFLIVICKNNPKNHHKLKFWSEEEISNFAEYQKSIEYDSESKSESELNLMNYIAYYRGGIVIDLSKPIELSELSTLLDSVKSNNKQTIITESIICAIPHSDEVKKLLF